MKRILLFASMLFLFSSTFGQVTTAPTTISRTYNQNIGGFNYALELMLYVPKGINIQNTYPLVLAFHGDCMTGPVMSTLWDMGSAANDQTDKYYTLFVTGMSRKIDKCTALSSPFINSFFPTENAHMSHLPGNQTIQSNGVPTINSVISKMLRNLIVNDFQQLFTYQLINQNKVYAIGFSGGAGFVEWINTATNTGVNPLNGIVKSYVAVEGLSYTTFNGSELPANKKMPMLLVYGTGPRSHYGANLSDPALFPEWKAQTAFEDFRQYIRKYSPTLPTVTYNGQLANTPALPNYNIQRLPNLDDHDLGTNTRLVTFQNVPKLFLLSVGGMDHWWPGSTSLDPDVKSTSDFRMGKVAWQFFKNGTINTSTQRSAEDEVHENNSSSPLDFTISPNPAVGEVVLSFDYHSMDRHRIVITNTLGQVVWSLQNVYMDSNNQIPVDVSTLPIGPYIVLIDNGFKHESKVLIKL